MPQFDEGFLALRGGGRRRAYEVKGARPLRPPSPALLLCVPEDEPPLVQTATALSPPPPSPRLHPRGKQLDTGGDGGGSGGGSGGKAGGRLARRARSFKEDFLEILAGMRSPGGGGGGGSSGAASAHGTPASATAAAAMAGDGSGGPGAAVCGDSLRELETLLKQVRFALRHFGDVVNKNTLEMLPGNGTVVLDTVAGIHTLLKNFALDGQSSTVASATNQVYQSVARLIKVCDDVLIHGEAALNKEEAMEVCSLVGDAVQNLVSLVRDKMTAPRPESIPTSPRVLGDDVPGLEVTQPYTPSEKRNGSMPEIPLSPREKLILEQTSRRGRGGSSDGDSPPPKPPLPSRFLGREFALETSSASSSPPPLPPKRRPRTHDDRRSPVAPGDEETTGLECSVLDTTCDGSGASIRSRSPDTSSLLSAGSLDSVPIQAEDNLNVNAPLPPGIPVGIMVRTPSPQERSLEASPLRRVIGTEGEEVVEDDEEDRRSESGFASLRSSGQSYGLGSASRGSQQSFGEPTNATTPPPLSPPNMMCRVISQQRQVQRRLVSTVTTTTTSTRRVISDPASGTTESDVLSTTSSSSSSSSCTFARHVLRSGGGSPALASDAPTPPPALPEKRAAVPTRLPRIPSQYDNVPDGGIIIQSTNTSESFTEVDGEDSESTVVQRVKESTLVSITNDVDDDLDKNPPPLPPKNRQINKYMEMFGNCTQLTGNEYQRHSMELYTHVQRKWQQAQRELACHPASMVSTSSHFLAFQRIHSPQSVAISSSRSLSLFSSSTIHSPSLPSSPPHNHLSFSLDDPAEESLLAMSQISANTSRPTSPPLPPADFTTGSDISPLDSPPALPPKRRSLRENTSGSLPPSSPTLTPPSRMSSSSPRPPEETVGPPVEDTIPARRVEDEEDDDEVNPLEELDVTKYLSFKRPEEDGPEIRGGHVDALVVQATKANKNEENETDFMYQEAFLTTYRTFLSPAALVDKLCFRHQHFSSSPDHGRQRAARNALSLLVRVVGDLTVSDLDSPLLNTLVEYEQQLVCSGDLTMARIFRLKLLERCEAKRLHEAPPILLPSLHVYTRQSSLLDFKSERVAEQMTLLDASLFARIEIPEVLVWAKEQNEERSPNLTRFTEHFNKMSYWARSRILEQSDAKERERHVAKFTKVMRHLRRLNNFNSYLALLSALDSAPVRRLEWQQRHVADTLKEYCALIDSSCSFRAYRQALAETHPPCIPYIGLVLQDLTFVHIGNSDLLADGTVNFSKRWQQFNIVENMKKFKKCQYNFKKNERIIAFFNNFDEFLCEEAMWQISESIRPRGGKKTPGQGDS
ncbi:guanine nucleotide-releasing factor 2 isoform X2 [Ischnura elegans]|uniref:guanine nucleotide-releasing factor 2 isoform X2 n=1 Tax=Ischnura elegans TaxID=197161 RepID=UPI001ED88115|nr:guanine nucleotide-releasing factor 2 isoform X2 [Ischnura elegans]